MEGNRGKEASKGNEVSGHTGDGGSTHTAGGLWVVGVVFFCECLQGAQRQGKREDRMEGKSNKVENVGTSHSIFHIVLCSHFITTLYLRNGCCVI